MNPIAALFAPNARRVFARNFLAWQKYAWSSVAINLVDPFVYLLAIGIGLGAYVTLTGHGTLLQFIAPGLLGFTAMNAATFDACWGCFERLNFNGVYESMVTAPVQPVEIAAGEYLWQGFRSGLYGTLFLLAMIAFGLVHTWWVLLCPLLFALTGMAFAAPSFFVAINVPTQEHLFFYFSFVVSPMVMIAGVFFPLDRLPQWLRDVAWCTPLYHAVSGCRLLLAGTPNLTLAADVLWLAVFLIAFAFVPRASLREKLGN
ncbi:MAG TPA: ABC transporter permease [Candidatus Eremiobacteraceae bacterium]|nr:ABC transporter permease [Candidatus Eremiobacteraceae bacterium]